MWPKLKLFILRATVILLVSCCTLLASLALGVQQAWAAGSSDVRTAPVVAAAGERCESVLMSPKTVADLKDLRNFEVGGTRFEAQYPELVQLPGEWDIYMHRYDPIHPSDPQFVEIRRLIIISDIAMALRRGWRIFEERMSSAIKYFAQTTYYELKASKKGTDPDSHDTRAILALVVAKDSLSQNIPMHDLKDERTGANWIAGLNRLRKECGILFEGKAYAIFKALQADPITSPGARDRVWIPLVNQMRIEAADIPGALDKQSFVTFGDYKSLPIWIKMGFEVLGEEDGFPPLRFGNATWYALRIEPSRIVHDQKNYTIPYAMRTPNQNITLTLPSGMSLVAEGTDGVTFPQMPSSTTIQFFSKIRQRIGENIWARLGADVYFDKGQLLSAMNIEGNEPGSPVQVRPGLWVLAGGGFGKEPDSFNVLRIAKPYGLLDGKITMPVGSSFDLYDNGGIYAHIDRPGAEIYPGIWAQREIVVESPEKRENEELTVWISDIAKPVQLSSGETLPVHSSIKLIFAANGAVRIEKTDSSTFESKRNGLDDYPWMFGW